MFQVEALHIPQVQTTSVLHIPQYAGQPWKIKRCWFHLETLVRDLANIDTHRLIEYILLLVNELVCKAVL